MGITASNFFLTFSIGGIMIIASMIVKTMLGKAEEVMLKLSKLPNISTHGIYKEDNIIVVIEAEKEEELESFAKYISSEIDDVLGVYPTFISAENE